MPSMTNVVVDSDKFTACAKVLFSSDSKSLYCVKSNGDIAIFSLSYNDEVDIKATISTKEGKKMRCLEQKKKAFSHNQNITNFEFKWL